MEQNNDEQFSKLQEYKDSMSSRMADQLDRMITSNRETIRMKCLEAALKYCEITKRDAVSEIRLKELAVDFYNFVKVE